MKSSCLGWAFAGAISIAALGYSGASLIWNGTWKPNASKSSISGPSFVITISPAGERHYDDGVYSYNFRCDGKEYSTRPSRTVSCLQTSAFAIDTTSKENGVKVATAHWELSPDGKMLTIKEASIQADGSIKPRELVYSRTPGSIGFAGGWNNTKPLELRDNLVLALNERSFHIAFTESGQYIDLPLDGSDAPMHGPGVRPGLTWGIRPNGPREFSYNRKAGGQIISQGSLRLSADGRTLVEEHWSPRAPNQKSTIVYEKQ